MNLRVYVPLTWTPAGSWLLYLPFPPRWNPVFTGGGYSFFGAIPPGRGEPNGVHFPLRLTFFVHVIGRKRQKIGRMFWGKVVLGSVGRDLFGFRAKNRPVYTGYGWKRRVGIVFGLSRGITRDRMGIRALQTGVVVLRRRVSRQKTVSPVPGARYPARMQLRLSIRGIFRKNRIPGF